MSKIAIKGVIVPSMFDDEWLAEDIEKGIFTPLSRVEKALEQAKDEPLELYINSPGGSVFSGHEMLNAIRGWQAEKRQPMNITVGAMAASAASTITTMLGPVKAHQNSMFMFHGAQSLQIGGSQAMGDMEKLLNKINGMVKSTLVGKYGMDADQVEEWFAEERMGWLTAQEAMQAKLVSEIIPADGEVISFPQADIDRYQQAGLAVAAMLETDRDANTGDYDMNLLQSVAEKLGLKAEQAKDESTVIQELEAKLKGLNDKCESAYDEGMEAGKAEGAKAAKAEAGKEIEDAKSSLEAEQKAKADAETRAAELQGKLDEAEKRISQIDKGFGGNSDTGNENPAQQFKAAVNELVEAGHSKEQASLKVQRESPAMHKAMIDAANRK